MPDQPPQTSQPEEPKKEEIARVRAPNLPSVYVNGANVVMGLFEVRLYVAEVTPLAEATKPGANITDRLCLIMSPEFAKALALQLTDASEKYTEHFGPLREVPAEVLPAVLRVQGDKTTPKT